MSSKHRTYKHGVKMIPTFRPKSKLRKRRNKALARVRKDTLWEKIAEKKKELEAMLQ